MSYFFKKSQISIGIEEYSQLVLKSDQEITARF